MIGVDGVGVGGGLSASDGVAAAFELATAVVFFETRYSQVSDTQNWGRNDCLPSWFPLYLSYPSAAACSPAGESEALHLLPGEKPASRARPASEAAA